MRILLLIAALCLLTTFAPIGLFRQQSFPAQATVWYEPVPLDEADPGRTRVGRLVYLGGWSLTSNDTRYGGISAIHVENGQLLALTDGGMIFRHALPGKGQGLPARAWWLRSAVGGGTSKQSRDTEAMAVHGGAIWVAYERYPVVWRYDRASLKGERRSEPAAMRDWMRNAGGEAMIRFPDGRFLILSEESRSGASFSDGLLFDRDPTDPSAEVEQFLVRRPKDYRITDAALLPDGRLLLLHRRLSYLNGISAKLTLIERQPIKAGATLAVREIAHFEPPLTVDNMEGLSVTKERGRTIVWIASDNNFMGIQRTLLLKFALEEGQ